MERVSYQIIFDHLEAARQNDGIQSVPTEEYGDYTEIAELSRLAEALREPEPLSFTIG